MTTGVTARQVVKRAVRLPVAHRFRLAWRLAGDARVPWRARLPLLALIAYLAMPLDLVPDFIPVLGQLDDVLIAGIAVWWFVRVCPPTVAMEHVEQLEGTSLGPVGQVIPWLVTALAVAFAALFIIWLLRR